MKAAKQTSRPSVPAMRFAAAFERSYQGSHIESLHVSNVVLHGSLRQIGRRRVLHCLLGRPVKNIVPSNKILGMSEVAKAPFSQHRVYTAEHGSVSLFSTGNIIRAARGHPASAVAAVAMFVRWLSKITEETPPWFTAISAPNAVATGMFCKAASKRLITGWDATKTSKFPGVAITLSTPGITPEVFAPKHGKSKFIVPGFRGPKSLALAMNELDKRQGSTSADN